MRRIALPEVVEAWSNTHGQAGRGMVIGGFVGAVGGAFLGLKIRGETDHNYSGADIPATGALLVAIPGMIIGGITGAFIPRWNRVFHR